MNVMITITIRSTTLTLTIIIQREVELSDILLSTSVGIPIHDKCKYVSNEYILWKYTLYIHNLLERCNSLVCVQVKILMIYIILCT